MEADDLPSTSVANNPPAVATTDNISASASSDNILDTTSNTSDRASDSVPAVLDYYKFAAYKDNSGVSRVLNNTQANIHANTRPTKNYDSVLSQPTTSTSTSSPG
jgi:hypothetical protein